MKITLILVLLCLACISSAIRQRSDRRQILINRPRIDAFGAREKRAPWPRPQDGVKGRRPATAPPIPLEMKLRKGEYVCGNKICKLEPGVVPKGCNGDCQYRIFK
ncbi:uncharacterized protein LOC110376643 [Helicoverpa armigera]|uniref:uncharacterized protein LOC110376643 n=1 Tax=Helicoverpa armigera TaxID=29058 RepID=UPI00308399ED